MLTFLALFILSIFSSLQGDFLVHFMDIAREELTKKPEEISAEKLQVCLVYIICLFVPYCHCKNRFLVILVMEKLTDLLLCIVLSLLICQSLLDIALRSTAAASDPTHEELICCVVNTI